MYDLIHFQGHQNHTTRANSYNNALAQAHFIANKYKVAVTIRCPLGTLEDEIIYPR